MKISLEEIADLVGGSVMGDKTLEINNVAKIEDATTGDLTFLYMPLYYKFLETTSASAVLIKSDFERKRDDIAYILVDEPEKAFQIIINKFLLPKFELNGIDETAYIDSSCKIGMNVSLGKNVVIERNSSVGDNTKIFHNTVILEKCKIGKNCLIFPNVTIREKCVIGDNVIIHPGTVIGSDGFGYNPKQGGGYDKVPQIGNVILEDFVELGSNVSVDRAAMGSTIIKKGAKIDNLVQIARNVSIDENTVISAQTGISGSTKIGKNAIVAGQVGFAGHLEISDNVMIGAQSGVSKSIKKPGRYFGYPAKDMGLALRLEGHIRNMPEYVKKINDLMKRIDVLEKKLSEKDI